jgi:WD40 repeat protein
MFTDPSGNSVSGTGVSSLAFSRDGILAVGDVDGRAYLWDVATRALTATIAPPINMAQGNASISKDGQPYPVAGAFPQDVNAAFSPDGTMLTADVDFGYGTCLYDVTTRNRLATLTDPGGQLNQAGQVAFSPDGTMITVTDSNGRTYLWHVPHPQRR